jgi:hypothetical protein
VLPTDGVRFVQFTMARTGLADAAVTPRTPAGGASHPGELRGERGEAERSE